LISDFVNTIVEGDEKMAISWEAIYVLWLREMKGMWRAR